MGQAFRRSAGRVRSSGLDTTSSSSSSSPFQSVNRKPPPPPPPPPPGPVDKGDVFQKPTSSSGASNNGPHGVLEERDPSFDSMLSQMSGRITTKPVGKSEMGEAMVSEKYTRPLPKVRNTNAASSRYEDRAAPPGTLNVAQLRQIMLLYHGKADDNHSGPMDAKQIAERFHLEVSQVQRILQFVSLPPEDTTNTRKKTDH